MASRKQSIETKFVEYKNAINLRNNKREDLIVLSRSITKDSKRVIFHLHNIVRKNKAKILEEALQKLIPIRKAVRRIAAFVAGDCFPKDFFLFEYHFSFGLQEFIEAESFLYFLKNGSLISREQLEEIVRTAEPEPVFFPIGLENYVLGLADLTGELMRFATNSVGIGDFETPFRISDFMNELYSFFLGLDNGTIRDLANKMDTMQQSVIKIETVCFDIRVKRHESK